MNCITKQVFWHKKILNIILRYRFDLRRRFQQRKSGCQINDLATVRILWLVNLQKYCIWNPALVIWHFVFPPKTGCINPWTQFSPLIMIKTKNCGIYVDFLFHNGQIQIWEFEFSAWRSREHEEFPSFNRLYPGKIFPQFKFIFFWCLNWNTS